MHCVKMQEQIEGGADDKKWTWVTHACNDTGSVYPICEYPYYPANFAIERNEGNVKYDYINPIRLNV